MGRRVITHAEAKRFAADHDMKYFEASAKEGTGIEGIFEEAGEATVEAWLRKPKQIMSPGLTSSEGFDFRIQRMVVEKDDPIESTNQSIRLRKKKCCE